jgi:protein MAK16
MSDMFETSWPAALSNAATVAMAPRRGEEDDDLEGGGFDEISDGLDDEFDDVEELEAEEEDELDEDEDDLDDDEDDDEDDEDDEFDEFEDDGFGDDEDA